MRTPEGRRLAGHTHEYPPTAGTFKPDRWIPGERGTGTSTSTRLNHCATGVPLNLSVHVSWPEGSDLTRAYFAGEERAVRFYSGPFDRHETYVAVAADLDRRFGGDERRALLPALRGRATEDESRLAEFVERGGYVVTTGQQAGLMTGPAFTIYKALTALSLAEKLENELDRPVLPVFWIASEDHDWEEACHTHLLDADNKVRRIDARPAEDPGDRSVFEIPLAAPEGLLRDVRDVLIPNDFRDACLEWIEAAYPEGASLADGFESLMDRFFGDRGLFLVRAEDPVIKSLSAGVLRGAIEHAASQEEQLRLRSQALEAAGFHTQVPVLANGLQVFESGDDGRARLFRANGGLTRGPDTDVEPLPAVLDRLDRDTARFSPNALLRPVAEAAAMPVIAYVAGPGEAAYYAQNSPLYEGLDVTMPVVHPRAQVLVVERKVEKVLAKYDLETDGLAVPVHELTTKLARDEMPEAVELGLRAIRSALGEGTEDLLAATRDIDPTLAGPVGHARNQSLHAFDEAEKKIVAAIKRGNETVTQQIEKARANLYPNGTPQERVINVFHFVSRYGPAVLDHLSRRIAVSFEASG